MRKTLLMIGSLINLVFGVFHLYLARVIQVSNSLPPANRPLMQVFNIAFILVLFFFAYVSFCNQTDLLTTKLGKSTLVLIALFYLLRAVEEIIFFKSSAIIFFPCLLVGGIYAVLFFWAKIPNVDN